MKVSEIFYSVQGEGPSLGVPAVFLRLFGCNLGCTWCDSQYAWQGGLFSELSSDEVLTAVLRGNSRGQSGCTRLVVTGGEPLLQAQVLSELVSDSPLRLWKGEVETNGTLLPPATLVDLGWQFNVSPKLGNSGVVRTLRYKPEVLRRFCFVGNVWFKFTVTTQEDIDEIEQIIEDCHVPQGRIILMPEGIDIDTLVERGRWLVEVCKERGWRFSPRLQIELYGNRRGV